MKTLINRGIGTVVAFGLAAAVCGGGITSASAKTAAAPAPNPRPAAASKSKPPQAAAAPVAVEPPSSIVVDVDTGKVLSQDNAIERRYPASTTKLMTAYLALKALRAETVGLDSPVIMTRRAAAEPPAKMGFQPGSVMRLDNALRMMLVKSANDVAYAIGQTIGGGSIEAFVDKMNQAAANLGMKDTHFVNPNGLPQDGQYSSAKDLAILAIAIRREFPAFSDYFGTEAVSTGASVIKNGNKLLGRFDGADGMKTGYICASGFNLVSSATRDHRTIVAVVLGANGVIPRERSSAAILEAAFHTDPSNLTTTVDQLPVSSGAPADISSYICSAKGRSARAEESAEESDREETFGSPYMHDMNRAPVTVSVSLGGASGNAIAAPGISLIAAYGIPIPTPRPVYPAAGPAEPESGRDMSPTALDDTDESKTTAMTTDPVAAAIAVDPGQPEIDDKAPRLGYYRNSGQ